MITDMPTHLVRTSTRRITYAEDGAVLDTDHGPFPVDSGFKVARHRHENMVVVLTVDARNFIVDIRVLDRAKPLCSCCGGSGMHETRPHIARSPDDEDAECTICEGRGRSEHGTVRNGCNGYRSLYKAQR